MAAAAAAAGPVADNDNDNSHRHRHRLWGFMGSTNALWCVALTNLSGEYSLWTPHTPLHIVARATLLATNLIVNL